VSNLLGRTIKRQRGGILKPIILKSGQRALEMSLGIWKIWRDVCVVYPKVTRRHTLRLVTVLMSERVLSNEPPIAHS
jgi:hypothetical protein